MASQHYFMICYKPMAKTTKHTASEKILGILNSTHLPPCLAVTAISALMAYFSGVRSGIFLVVPTVLLGQFSVGWCNDYLDRKDDILAKRIEKPLVSGIVKAETIKNLSLVSLFISIVLSFLYSVPAGIVYSVAMASAFLYNFRLKNSPFSIVTYMVSFGLLPVFIALGNPRPFIPAYWMILASGLLGAGVHFQNVIPDFEVDKIAGIKGLPHYFYYQHALLLGSVFLVLSALCIGLGIGGLGSVTSRLVLGSFAAVAILFSVLYFTKQIDKAYKSALLLSFLGTLVMISGAPFMRVI